jgi:hypothetical protein
VPNVKVGLQAQHFITPSESPWLATGKLFTAQLTQSSSILKTGYLILFSKVIAV